MFWDKAIHFFVAFFEHANAIKVELESGEVRENWVRKSHCRDGFELQIRRMSIRYTACETMELGESADPWIALQIPADEERDQNKKSSKK
jgi:hypothetical protein